MLNKLLLTTALTLPLALGCTKAEESAQEPAAAKPAPSGKVAKAAEPTVAEPVAEEEAAKDPHDVEGIKAKLSPDEVAALLAEKKAHVFDANSDKTRQKFGKVPGATLLTSAKEYDLGILPEDKAAKLVFYCSNTMCSAAGKGAKRAVVAGYTDVNVMPEGIMGWKDSGKKTEEIKMN